MAERKRTLATVLTAIAWGMVGGLSILVLSNTSLPLFKALEESSFQSIFCWFLIWLAGGLATALVLRWTNASITWLLVLLLALGWALAGSLPWYIRFPLGGLLTVLIIRQANSTLSWYQGLIIIVGWVAGGSIPALAGKWFLPSITGVINSIATISMGLILGVIGGGIMFWQLSEVGWSSLPSNSDTSARSILRMKDTLDSHPIMTRLMTSAVERQLFSISGGAIGLGLGGSIICLFVWSSLKIALPPQNAIIVFVIIYLITLAPIARAPMVIAATTAFLTASSADEEQSQLLHLTSLRKREMVWVYTTAPLRHLRNQLKLDYIVMGMVLAGGICAFIPSLPSIDTQVILGVSAGLLTTLIGMLGMNVLGAAIGMRMALWWRDPNKVVIYAALVMLLSVLIALMLAILGLQFMLTTPTIQMAVGFIFFMLTPYIIALELVGNA